MAGEALTIRGSLVYLRTLEPADITDEHVSWLNDPKVVRFSNQRFFKHDLESCLKYLNSFQVSDNLYLSVRAIGDDRRIGTMTAYFAKAHGTVDMGILMGDVLAWGKGYGQDAWDTLMNWLLLQPTVRKVTAGTLACNRGMVKLAERSGMHIEGVRKAQEIVDGRAEDILYFARFVNAQPHATDRDRLP